MLNKVHNAKKGRDSATVDIYIMTGIPQEIIEERLHQKTIQKATKLENDLKKMGINVDDPKFDIALFEVPNPRPPKAKRAMPPMN